MPFSARQAGPASPPASLHPRRARPATSLCRAFPGARVLAPGPGFPPERSRFFFRLFSGRGDIVSERARLGFDFFHAAFLQASPTLTIPHSRPSLSVTGRCRTRRSVIIAMTLSREFARCRSRADAHQCVDWHMQHFRTVRGKPVHDIAFGENRPRALLGIADNDCADTLPHQQFDRIGDRHSAPTVTTRAPFGRISSTFISYPRSAPCPSTVLF